MDRLLINIPIERKNHSDTRSASFKGFLKIVSNEFGVIFDWNVDLTELTLDLYTTESWFTKSTTLFELRKNLFNYIGIQEQEVRPTRSSNKLWRLNDQQLKLANEFINDRNLYKSTIKNIVGLIKGNNPGGEAANPNSAEMVISDCEFENFVILIDDLIMKHNDNFDAYALFAKEISIEEFANLNAQLNNAFKYMQKHKTKEGFSEYLRKIKEYYKEYNEYVSHAQKIAIKARNEYGKNVDQNIKKLPFNLIDKNDFEKCHIYEFHDLRDQIVIAMRENKPYEKYVEMIKDPNNFIPLPGEYHRQFDKNNFTYDVDGKLVPLNKDGEEYVSNRMKKDFMKIDEDFLNESRKKYLSIRNELVKKG